MGGDAPKPGGEPMSTDALLATWIAPARRRVRLNAALIAVPLVIAVTALAARLAGTGAAVAITPLGVAGAGWWIGQSGRRFGRTWLVRRLDDSRADMEDSAGLLFADPQALSALQRMQQARLGQRLDAGVPGDLAPDWSRRLIAVLWAGVLIVLLAAWLWPRADHRAVTLAPGAEGLPATPGIARLVGQNLRIIPPAYTGLPVRDDAKLDARAPLGSRLEWTLRFDPQAQAPGIVLLGGARVALRRDGGNWIVSRTLDAAFLYRVDAASGRGALPPLHRIDAVADAPPQVKVVSPAASLTMVTPGQRNWMPVFAAIDDYGVAANARLRITLAVGEGENITFSEREIGVTGTGTARDRRFAPRLDFGALGFGAGGDMVVQLIVRDNHAPAPQEVRGPSLILRWPSAGAPESSGLTGMVNTTLPAYFRSQRQIIMDAEALIKRRRGLLPDRYLSQSNSIGNDQQILRGRYSQFLGGETEGAPELPTSEAQPDAHGPGDGHDHGAPASTPAFGAQEDVLAEFGHPHDDSPASSLDPETRAILKQAVDEMWQSEMQLKQGKPDLALPYAYKALRFIKEVQQATRIFLSRTGPQLPPIDAARRMTGKRDGLASRTMPVAPVEGSDGPVAAAWRALGQSDGAIAGPIRLDALDAWVRTNGDRLPDPLALAGALDSVRREPDCAACRVKLRALLWAAMERPPAQPARRRPADAQGARYLRAIGGEQ